MNLLGKERYTRYMLRDEDLLANYVIFNIAKSFKFLGRYCIIHIKREKSASAQLDDIQQNKQKIYVIDAALEFSKNLKKNKQWIIYYIIALLNKNKLEVTLEDEYVNELFISCLDRIFKTQKQYFYDKDRHEIKKRIIGKKYITYKF